MKTISLISRLMAMVSLTAITFSPISQKPAEAIPNFNCGPHFMTFQVALDGRQGAGVRCLKVLAPHEPNIRCAGGYCGDTLYWYGEGQWSGKGYRHLGRGSHTIGRSQTDLAAAQDLPGGRASLQLSLVQGSWNNPREIRVTGAWSERWIRTSGFPYQPQPRPTSCGSAFTQLTAVDASGRKRGTGLRCIHPFGPSLRRRLMWFGNGEWNGARYTHIGFGSSAADLCGTSFGTFCNAVPPGGLNIRQMPNAGQTVYQITGAWNELWR